MNPSDLPSALRARRAFVIGAAALSGILVFISMLVDPVPQADGRDLIAGYAGDLTRSGMHTNLLHYGFALVAPVVYAMVGLVRGRGGWLANIAGVFAVLGLSTLPGLVMLDFASVATALSADLDTAVAMETQLGELPYFILLAIPAFACSVIALPVAVAALWRAGFVPGYVVAIAVLAALAPNVAPAWWIGFGINAGWMLAVAMILARVPLAQWYGSSVSTPAAEEREDAPV
jgi:hypothetical protein